jgi:hypothetical protein
MRLLYSPDLGDAYSVVWYSAIQKDRANKNSFADGFTGIQWNRTSPYDDDGRYKFQVVAIFYKPGSKTKVDGKTIWQPEQLNAKFESEPPFLYPYDFCVAQE